ncbi:MAG: hypothetical protein INF52_01080 [Rhodobacter sp.]|nr:hypothetical protein [Rhodobacter sp.]
MDDEASPRWASLGDVLATDATSRAQRTPSPRGFAETIRACAEALDEDPEELLRLANGTTPLARLTRLLLGEKRPAAGVSRDQVLWLLHRKLRGDGLAGRALWDEVVRQHFPKIDAESARKGVQRYNKHLRERPLPKSLPEIFMPQFFTDKTVKPRGPKPGHRRGTKT